MPLVIAAVAWSVGGSAQEAGTGEAAPVVLPAGSHSEAGAELPASDAASAVTPRRELVDAGLGIGADASAAKPDRPMVPGVWQGLAPGEVLRETPRQTVSGFLEAAAAEDWERAALYLDLRSVPPAMRKARGPELARLFAEVLERTVWLDVEAVPDDPEGIGDGGATPPRDVRVVNVTMPGGSQGVRLEHVKDNATGERMWLFSRATVQSIEKMHAEHGLPDAVQKLPAWSRRRLVGMQVWQAGGVVLLALGAWLAGRLLDKPITGGIRRAIRGIDIERMRTLPAVAAGPLRRVISLVILRTGLGALVLSAAAETAITRVVDIGLILVGMQVAIRLVTFAAQAVLEESADGNDDVARMKTVATRVTAIRRIANVIIFVVGVALALMQFPVARSAGWSLLGSAGLAGAILGFAAQKTVSNLFAGILIALTQPMRIGDTVIVEGEWGVIEEIGLTHVVVRIWDLRRLVMPVTWFLDQPFQNWTRTSSELIGTVFVHADFAVDVDAVRGELAKVLEGADLWNGKTAGVVVSDLTDRSVVLRLTVSADDADKLWDLRCLVRERMLRFLQQDASRLPKMRLVPPAV